MTVTSRRADLEASSPLRLAWVDAVRGAAIVLMVLDHVLVQVDPHSSLRAGAPWSITRLSLPLFMLASAAVWRRDRPLRPLLLVILFEFLAYPLLGMGSPAIVTVLALVLLLVRPWADDARPVTWYAYAVLGLVQGLYVPIEAYEGYQPGLVLVWFALGRLFCLSAPWSGVDAYVRVPRWLRWLEPVGRWPRSWYVGHLALLLIARIMVSGVTLAV